MTCPPSSIAVYNEKSHRYTTFFYAHQELKVAGCPRIPDCKLRSVEQPCHHREGNLHLALQYRVKCLYRVSHPLDSILWYTPLGACPTLIRASPNHDRGGGLGSSGSEGASDLFAIAGYSPSSSAPRAEPGSRHLHGSGAGRSRVSGHCGSYR